MRFFGWIGGIIFILNTFFISLNAEYIIKTKKANLRVEPSINSKVISILYEYESIKILKRQGSWVKVKTIDGTIGWVNKSVVEKIDNLTQDDLENNDKVKDENTNIKQQISQPIAVSNSQVQLKEQPTLTTIQDNSNIKNISSSYTNNEDLYEYYPKNNKKYKLVKERRRIIGEHIFPSTVLFPSPIPSARFGFSEGFGMVKGYYVYPYEDPDTNEIELETQKINYFGFEQKFDIGIVVTDNISLDLNIGILLSGGMENKDFTTLNASPEGNLRIGPNFSYKMDNNLLLSFSPRLYYSKSVNISADSAINNFFETLDSKINDSDFENLLGNYDGSIENLFSIINSTYVKNVLKDAIPSFTKALIINETDIGIAPSLGFAYPISKFWGVQGSLEYIKMKSKEENKAGVEETSTDSNFNFNLGTSFDFNNMISFPMGIILEYSREGGDIVVNSFGLGIYYQGIGDVQLGVLLNKSKIKEKSLVDISQTFAQFSLTYFF